MAVSCTLKDYDNIVKRINGLDKKAEVVTKRLLSDANTRAPGWIAAEVAKEYGVKKGEVNSGKLGSVRVKGDSITTARIVYKGRVLTPSHFGMTPKAPGKGAYTLKASIIRGQKTQLGKVKKLTKKQRANIGKNFKRQGEKTSDHSPIMLMHTGNAKEGGTDYIPFQRKSTNRKDIKAIKTVSLPQMVSSDRTRPGIDKAISENMGKRLEHHLKLLQK